MTGLTKRLIACLDVRDDAVVKGVQFDDLRTAGDPASLARRYNAEGIDELVLLDVTATLEGRATFLDTVHAVANELFIPFTVGGGIRTLDDARAVFDAGADKVSINSAALGDPALITSLARVYGSQAVVVAIDAALETRRTDSHTQSWSGRPSGRPSMDRPEGRSLHLALPPVLGNQSGGPGSRVLGGWRVYSRGGTTRDTRDAVAWACEAEARGAGEILLTSIDRDGTKAGFDLDLTAAVSRAVNIPVIASGGAGTFAHFADVFTEGCADAALAASVFHFNEHAISDLKSFLASRGIPMRPAPSPC